MTGIIGAMTVEVENLIEQMTAKTTARFSGIHFVKGQLGGAEVVVARCGMGKVNAAVCAQTMILKFHPEVIINTGVAGSISPIVKMGDIVIGKNTVQHDMDLSPIGMKKGFIQEMDGVLIPCSPEVVKKMESAAQKLETTCNCHTGIIATGDQFINSPEDKARIFEEFDALACEMEGASIAQVCALNHVKFGLVRTISDNADGDSPEDFNQFVEEAAQKSIAMITEFLS
jgi:adenosylhomocysteine nucleosidase